MSKSALMKGMGAKSSTPLRQSEADKASTPAVLRDAVLTDEMILELRTIDERWTGEKIKQWVQNWANMRVEVNLMADLTDEMVHETMGSAQLFAAEINGWVVTALMMEKAFDDPPGYLYIPDSMREIKPINTSTFTILEIYRK